MDTNSDTARGTIDRHQIVSWSIIIALFILRIPILGVLGIFTQAAWLDIVYEIGTYFFTAVFLWWECKNLEDFHIDMLALWIIIVCKPLETLLLLYMKADLPFEFPHVPSLLIWAIAIGLAITMWLRRRDLPKFQWKSLGWFGIGTLAGIGLAAILAIPGAYQVDFSTSPSQFWLMLGPQTILSFLYQIGYAAVSEEPFFRGFLWGALRKAGWKDVWIWLLQAGLFTVGHIYYFGKHPIAFFVIVPVIALVLGLAVWKSRTISTSLPMHGMENAVGLFFERLAAYYIIR